MKESELLKMDPPIVIQPGEEIDVSVKLAKTYIRGAAYSVVVRTETGALYQVITNAS
ncbi:MAG: hypothetical protein QXE10_04125 [Desulfurococcaceae archaeon]